MSGRQYSTQAETAAIQPRVAVRRDTTVSPADWRPVTRLDEDGVTVPQLDAAAFGRYVWLDLQLGEGDPVRALGEVAPPRDAQAIALDIRFKHLFPDSRRRLLAALAAR